MSMQEVKDNVNRMFVREVLVKLEAKCGNKFTYDACCDNNGVNAHCQKFSSPANSFLKSDVCGQHVWLHAPLEKLESFMKHYLKCKGTAPQTTSACIVVPKGEGKWSHLLKNMQLLETFDKGSMLFSAPVERSGRHELGPSPWDLEIWYDPPSKMQINSLSNDGEQLLMTFSGSVAGSQAVVLVDNGATHSFVDRAFVAKSELKLHSSPGDVLCAGNMKVPVQGFVKARVKVR